MASVAEIDGITIAPPGINPDAATSGFLFTYSGAAVAYSVRQLNNNAPYVLRVRRVTGTGNTGNDDEADVKFDTTLTDPTISLDSPVDNFSAGGSNATTLGEFLNVGTVGGTTYSDADSLFPNTAEAYATKWYDLTGNQNHAEQTTPAKQPQIHDGTVNTDLITENGKPAVDFDGSNDNFRVDFSSIAQPCTYFATCTNDKTVFNYSVLFSSNGNSVARQSAEFTATTGRIRMFAGSPLTSVPTVGTSQRLLTYVVDSTNSEIWADASSIVSGNAGTYEQDGLTIGSDWNALGGFWLGTTQELILYPSNQDTAGNRTGIEIDINGFFGIY